MAENDITCRKIMTVDVIGVDMIPEKKGLFIKHVEYIVTSKRFSTEVCRRYNDFLAFHDVLLTRFPYRLIPKLPPKKVVGVFPSDSNFLENRRKALRRWLSLVARHPIISQDALLEFFLTQSVPDVQLKMKEVFKSIPDEFTTSYLAEQAKDLVPANNSIEFASSREQIRIIHTGVQKMKEIAEHFVLRSQGCAMDLEELGNVLTDMALENGNSNWGMGSNNHWIEIRKGLDIISKEFPLLSSKTKNQCQKEEDEVCEKLSVLLDVLTGYEDLCERVERGVSQEHQAAMSKMLALKKRQLQGVLRGSHADEVAALENRMLQQESVIASVELRTAFSLYCVRLETQLVHAYLETLAQVLNSLVNVQIQGHLEVADVWKMIQPTIAMCLAPNISQISPASSSIEQSTGFFGIR